MTLLIMAIMKYFLLTFLLRQSHTGKTLHAAGIVLLKNLAECKSILSNFGTNFDSLTVKLLLALLFNYFYENLFAR
jgi:hypothetical protein